MAQQHAACCQFGEQSMGSGLVEIAATRQLRERESLVGARGQELEHGHHPFRSG
jgi:hypothetical protein